MPFDFTQFSQLQLVLFLIAFGVVFLAAQTILHAKKTVIVRLGGVISVVIYALSSVVMGWHWPKIGLGIAGVLILLVGYRDEQKSLRPMTQLIAQMIIVGCVVLFGWRITVLTNIFGDGVLFLPTTIAWNTFFMWSPLVTFFFLLFIINAFNWIDGIDSLAAATAVPAFIVLICISLLPATQDIQTLNLGMIGLGAVSAFALWNLPPARTYLGTTGSWFLGLFIGLLAVNSGGKIATTLLVLAIPTLDALFVVVARFLEKQPLWQGDTHHHIHHRLQRAGFSPRAAVILLGGMNILLGIAAVLLQTHGKIIVFVIVGVVLATGILYLERRKKKL